MCRYARPPIYLHRTLPPVASPGLHQSCTTLSLALCSSFSPPDNVSEGVLPLLLLLNIPSSVHPRSPASEGAELLFAGYVAETWSRAARLRFLCTWLVDKERDQKM